MSAGPTIVSFEISVLSPESSCASSPSLETTSSYALGDSQTYSVYQGGGGGGGESMDLAVGRLQTFHNSSLTFPISRRARCLDIWMVWAAVRGRVHLKMSVCDGGGSSDFVYFKYGSFLSFQVLLSPATHVSTAMSDTPG